MSAQPNTYAARYEALAKDVRDRENARRKDYDELEKRLIEAVGTVENSPPRAADPGAARPAAPEDKSTGSAPPAVAQPDPSSIVDAIIPRFHDGDTTKAALGILEVKGAQFVQDGDAIKIKTKDGTTYGLDEGLAALLPPYVFKPKGVPGSGTRAADQPIMRAKRNGGDVLQRYAESGHDFAFYTKHRDEILEAKKRASR